MKELTTEEKMEVMKAMNALQKKVKKKKRALKLKRWFIELDKINVVLLSTSIIIAGCALVTTFKNR